MRGLFTIVGLLVTLAVVGVLVKKQLAPTATADAPTLEDGTQQSGPQTSQQIQTQVKQSMDAALQTPRAIPDDK